MTVRTIGLVCLLAFALVGAFFGWRWGQEYWYGRYALEDGYDAFWDGDHGRAHPILRAHARNGDPRSQTYLAMQYVSGKGTARSERQAFVWMERAAQQDYPDALVNLGKFYISGIGVPEDPARAFEYYERAAAAGHPDGIAGTAYVELFSRGSEQEGLRLLERAIADGSNFGRMIACNRAGPGPHGSWVRHADPDILETCIRAGLGGYVNAMERAVYLLYSHESPVGDPERAYELAIIGLAWWPGKWSETGIGLSITPRAAVFDSRVSQAPPPNPFSDDPVADLQTPANTAYWQAVEMLETRVRTIGVDPASVLNPPEFGPEVTMRLDPVAVLRAENAARAFLSGEPRRGVWME